MKKYYVIVLFFCFVLFVKPCGLAGGDIDNCSYWHSRVDPNVDYKGDINTIDESKEEVIMQGIECLLKCEGNTRVAKFWGATGYTTSGGIVPSPVEVAALFYISYLYYQDWEHCGAVTLIDINHRGENNENTKDAIKKAYNSYRKWFQKVKEIGLRKARAMNLDPLCFTEDVCWY